METREQAKVFTGLWLQVESHMNKWLDETGHKVKKMAVGVGQRPYIGSDQHTLCVTVIYEVPEEK